MRRTQNEENQGRLSLLMSPRLAVASRACCINLGTRLSSSWQWRSSGQHLSIESQLSVWCPTKGVKTFFNMFISASESSVWGCLGILDASALLRSVSYQVISFWSRVARFIWGPTGAGALYHQINTSDVTWTIGRGMLLAVPLVAYFKVCDLGQWQFAEFWPQLWCWNRNTRDPIVCLSRQSIATDWPSNAKQRFAAGGSKESKSKGLLHVAASVRSCESTVPTTFYKQRIRAKP